jgi:CDP-paratose 2-epimerase
MKMKVLITGGLGFVGSHVAEYYASRDADVTVLDNFYRSKQYQLPAKISQYNLTHLQTNYPNIHFIRGDIREKDALFEAAKDVEIIFHLASQVAVTSSIQHPRLDFEINALGTFNILEIARKSSLNPVVIYASSNKVYGSNVNIIPVEEQDTRYTFASDVYQQGIPEDLSIDLCEHTPYGCSKLTGDLYVQDYAHVYGLKTGVFRMSCIYGERQFGVEDQGWLAWFTIATVMGQPITIYGDGKQVRDILHVTDLVRIYDAFVRSRHLTHGVFNVGGGVQNTLSLLEALDLIEKYTNQQPTLTFEKVRPGDQKVYISNIEHARQKLDWRPKIGVNEGVERLVYWVQKNVELFG